jgi:hypothetical protein
MKLTADRPFSDPDKAARKLVEIANTVEAVQDGRIHIELINTPFLQSGGSIADYKEPTSVSRTASGSIGCST